MTQKSTYENYLMKAGELIDDVIMETSEQVRKAIWGRSKGGYIVFMEYDNVRSEMSINVWSNGEIIALAQYLLDEARGVDSLAKRRAEK